MSKKIPLLKYNLIIQYLEVNKEDTSDLYTKNEIYDTYKMAKKYSQKLKNSLLNQHKKIVKISISPVLLEENLNI